MAGLVPPHGGKLKPLKLEGEALADAVKKARALKSWTMTTRERDDLIMMGIGAFSPLRGFFTKADWRGTCDEMKMSDGTFWPIPVTVSVTREFANTLREGEEIALMGTFITSVFGVAFYQLIAPFYEGGAVAVAPDWLLGLLFGVGGLGGMYLGARTQRFVPAAALKTMLGAIASALALCYIIAYLTG